MKCLAAVLLAAGSLSAVQSNQTFLGTVTESECAGAGHAQMRMGPTDADCVVACVMAHGAQYVLLDRKDVYILSDQQTPERFAAQRVRVTGTLDATLHGPPSRSRQL